MKEAFKNYLVYKGYREYTKKGNPSTVYDYCKRIDKICEWENIDWNKLKENISIILPEYEVGGKKEALGAKSHNAIRCALRCFRDFVFHIG